MSNQSNNNRFNKNRDFSLYNASNTEGNSTKDTFLKNGSNIIRNEFNNFSTPTTRRESEGVNPYVLDAKIKDLESKLSSLEQTNQVLLERINNNERSFQVQLKQLQVNNLEERENRYKTEKVMNNISEQNNANSNDLNIKLNMLQEAFVKGDQEKMLQRQNDLESQKYLIGKLTEKITKTVKSEVEARYKADMDGTWLGREVAPMLKKFYADKKVDLSSVHIWEEDPGVMDYVVIAGLVRSPMGRFQTLFSTGKRWWSIPKEEDIAGCKAAAIDPFFREETLLAAEICMRHGVPYVTIDNRQDSFLHRHAAINVVSKECTETDYSGMEPEAIMELMQQETDGLTILTQGGGDMLYGRKGEKTHRMRPFEVDVRSTLGAGDTFKAGCVYALLHGMSDEETVRFASACSAIAIARFPLPLNPPRLEEVMKLIDGIRS